MLTLEPGGVVELHGHKDHPTVLHVIKGTLTSHPQGKPEMVLRAGVGLADEGSNFWVQNTGSEPAEFIWLPVYEFHALVCAGVLIRGLLPSSVLHRLASGPRQSPIP